VLRCRSCFAESQLRAGVRAEVVQTGPTRPVPFVERGQQSGADVSVASVARRADGTVRAQGGGAHLGNAPPPLPPPDSSPTALLDDCCR